MALNSITLEILLPYYISDPDKLKHDINKYARSEWTGLGAGGRI